MSRIVFGGGGLRRWRRHGAPRSACIVGPKHSSWSEDKQTVPTFGRKTMSRNISRKWESSWGGAQKWATLGVTWPWKLYKWAENSVCTWHQNFCPFHKNDPTPTEVFAVYQKNLHFASVVLFCSILPRRLITFSHLANVTFYFCDWAKIKDKMHVIFGRNAKIFGPPPIWTPIP